MASPESELVAEFRFFRAYKDGHVELKRPPCQKIPPSNDPITGVQSKDLFISIEPHVSARLYLPTLTIPAQKLPILLYVHGGGFCMQSAFAPMFHDFCTKVASEAQVIVVSVEYGLFPTRPIPACYEDSWTALRWVATHVNGDGPEPWLKDHVDYSKVFIGGDSAGGNITHTLAVRVGSTGLAGVRVVGVVLVHPYFGGTEDDKMWMFMCPTNSGLDDPRMNPGMEDLGKLGCERMLIFVAEKDHLNVVGKSYYEKVKKSEWKGSVELVENENEGHCFHLFNPMHDMSLELRSKFVSFLKQD